LGLGGFGVTQTRSRSTFYGPQHAFYRQDQWPAPCKYHLQLHDMLPGDLWEPAKETALYTPQILLPTGQWNHWRKLGPPFFYLFRQRLVGSHIHVSSYVPPHNFFICELPCGVHTFAYTLIKSPVGVFAYGGYATLSRERT